MKTDEQLKQIVKDTYAGIADQSKEQNETSCCGATCGCSTIDEALMAEDYSKLEGYIKDADLGLGCGLPTEFAAIKPGDTVVDLGSGAGNDCFVARSITGPTGKIIGVDFTERMVEKARSNAEKLKLNNVEFRFGDIERIPITAQVADVVVSNCVMNLVPNKKKAFAETFRIMKNGGHFSISDIVLVGKLPQALKESAEMYAGCVSGAIQKEEYLAIIQEAGFSNIQIQKEKKISLPAEIVSNYLDENEMKSYKDDELGIYSITVYAEKQNATACCEPGCCN